MHLLHVLPATCAALAVAMGGANVASANLIPGSLIVDESITEADVRDGSLSTSIADDAIGTAEVANDSLTGLDLLESSLGKVPSAAHADTADHATSADSAGHATTAGSAATATSAGNADKLDNIDSTGFVGGAMLATPFQDTITIPPESGGGLGGDGTAGHKLAFGVSCSFASTPPGAKVVFGQVTGEPMTLFVSENGGAPTVVTQPHGPIQASGQFGSSFFTAPAKIEFQGYNAAKRFSATLWVRQIVAERRCELTGTVLETR